MTTSGDQADGNRTAPALPTALSAFSGVGGMDLGIEAAGFCLVGTIELDELARSSVRANRNGQWPVVGHDIADFVRSVSPADLGLDRGELSLLAAGPPCQPFSTAAQWSSTSRTGIDDHRSDCLYDLFRLIDVFLPEAILLENVPGFISGRTSTIELFASKLQQINERHASAYRIETAIVDAADYGVPQHRRRAIVVARRDGRAFAWPPKTHVERPVRAWDAIGALRLRPSEIPQARGAWAGLLPSIPEGQNYLWHTDRGGGRPLFGYRRRFWSFLLKLSKNEPSWTLPAQPGPSTGPFHWESRPLAVREMLRLQSFPATWTVEGNYRQRVHQVGNATPPLLAEVLARAILQQLCGTRDDSPLRYRIPRRRSVPEAERIQHVPARFRRLEGKHPAHPGTGLGPRPR